MQYFKTNKFIFYGTPVNILTQKLLVFKMDIIFWNWIGSNSGQIQTLLALIGLIFAFVAAFYAKKQIKLSQDQRLFELKLMVLQTAHECKELIYAIKDKHNDLKAEYTKLLSHKNMTLKDLVEGCNYNHEEYLDKYMILLKEPEDVVNKLIKGLGGDSHIPNLGELELYSKYIIDIKGSIYNSHNGYLRRISNLKKLNETI